MPPPGTKGTRAQIKKTVVGQCNRRANISDSKEIIELAINKAMISPMPKSNKSL